MLVKSFTCDWEITEDNYCPDLAVVITAEMKTGMTWFEQTAPTYETMRADLCARHAARLLAELSAELGSRSAVILRRHFPAKVVPLREACPTAV